MNVMHHEPQGTELTKAFQESDRHFWNIRVAECDRLRFVDFDIHRQYLDGASNAVFNALSSTTPDRVLPPVSLWLLVTVLLICNPQWLIDSP